MSIQAPQGLGYTAVLGKYAGWLQLMGHSPRIDE